MASGISNSPTPRKRWLGSTGLSILLILCFIVIGYWVYQTISSKKSALLVESNPEAVVYINGEQKGKTPIEMELSDEEVLVKIVPGSIDPPTAYETKVQLARGIKTIVRRKFSGSSGGTYGQIISFDKSPGPESYVAVVTNPDGAKVSIDGSLVGPAPIKFLSPAGEHTLTVLAEGFVAQEFQVKTVSGFTLTAVADMDRVSELPSEQVLAKEIMEVVSEWAEIVDTPVGFLRVRESANIGSKEVGRVSLGEKYPIVDYDEDENWYKIELRGQDPNESPAYGWVSGDYVQIAEE